MSAERRGLASRILAAYRTIAVLVLNLVLMVGALALGTVLYQRFKSRRAAGDARVTSSYYKRQPWGAQFTADAALTRTPSLYEPYVVWKHKPVQSATVNVSDRSERVTTGSACTSGAPSVLMFGGSTMWGLGVPDWATVPSYEQHELQVRNQKDVCVRNLGELGFVSSQEVIKLMAELRAGRVPSVVVFYDGVNDVVTAWDSRRAGVHYYYDDTKKRFEQPLLGQWLASTPLMQFLGRFKSAPPRAKRVEDLDSLAQQVVDVYVENARMVAALAHEYGFQYELYWQPNLLVGRPHPTREEIDARNEVSAAQAKFYQSVYARMRVAVAGMPHVHDVDSMLDSASAQMYFDFMHLLPEGNAMVASRIAADVVPDLDRGARVSVRSAAGSP